MNYFQNFRKEFPLLTQYPSLIYLDNAATTHKPLPVLDAVRQFYIQDNSNTNRGVYKLAEKATLALENSRKIVQKFISASHPEEIIFTKGTTESLNLVANSITNLNPGDKILVTQMEHHSNLLPWQKLAKHLKERLIMLPITPDGEIDREIWKNHLSSQIKIIALTHVSNVLGTINPIKELIKIARQVSPQAIIIVDGAQAVAHIPVDVVDLDCDFYAFSGHKMYAPMGIGVLYGKKNRLEHLDTYQVGGGTLNTFAIDNTEYTDLPFRLEAGTPNVAGAVGLASAINFLTQVGWEKIQQHENILYHCGKETLSHFPELKIQGKNLNKIALFSFYSKKIHSHDLASILGEMNIAVRAGHHCALPLMEFYDTSSTVRISTALYNTCEDFDVLAKALQQTKNFFKTL